MKVIGLPILEEFRQRHADAASQIDNWLCEVEEASWHQPKDIKKRYPSASFFSENRVVFNLKGNRYRLEVKVQYKTQHVLVKRIGTHAEYNRWKF